MPICDLKFENTIFSARQTGHICKEDAEMWVRHLRQYAMTSSRPIVVLIDGREATYMSVEARMVLARASVTPNVKMYLVVNDSNLTLQFTRMIEMLSQPHPKMMFTSLEEAIEQAYIEAEVVRV